MGIPSAFLSCQRVKAEANFSIKRMKIILRLLVCFLRYVKSEKFLHNFTTLRSPLKWYPLKKDSSEWLYLRKLRYLEKDGPDSVALTQL